MRWIVIAIVASSCVLRDDITTRVTLRDPAKIEVAVETPTGFAPVMPEMAVRGEIPASSPPYVGTAETGSWVERAGASIDVWCPACRVWRRRTVVDDAPLAFDGAAAELLHVDGDQLHIRYDYDEAYRCGRHRCLRPKLALQLVTPLANVAAIDFVRRVSPRNGGGEVGGAVVSLAYAGGGLALGVIGIAEHERGLDWTGGAMAAVGAAVFVWMLHDLRATHEHHAVSLAGR